MSKQKTETSALSSKRSASRSRSRSTKSSRFVIPNNTSTLANDVFSFEQLVYCLPKLNNLPCLHKELCAPLAGDITYGLYLQQTSKYRECQCLGTSRNVQAGEYYSQLSTILTEEQLVKDLRSTKKISKDLRGLLLASIPADAHPEGVVDNSTTRKKPFVMSDGVPISVNKKKIYFNNYANFANFLDYYKIKRHSFCIFENCPHFFLGFGDNRTAKRHIWNHLKDIVINRNTYAFFEEEDDESSVSQKVSSSLNYTSSMLLNDERFEVDAIADDHDDDDYDDLLTVDQKILKKIRKKETGTIENSILASFFYRNRWRCDICHNIFILDDKSSHSSSCANNAITSAANINVSYLSSNKKLMSASSINLNKNSNRILKSKSTGFLSDAGHAAAPVTPIKSRRSSNVSSLMKFARTRSNSSISKKNRRDSSSSISSVVSCSTLRPENILEKDLELDPRFCFSAKSANKNVDDLFYQDYNLLSPSGSAISYENTNNEEQTYSISLGVDFDSFTSLKNATPSKNRSWFPGSSFLNDTPSKIFLKESSSLVSPNGMRKYQMNYKSVSDFDGDIEDNDGDNNNLEFDEHEGDGSSRSSSMSSMERIPVSIFDDSFSVPFFKNDLSASTSLNSSADDNFSKDDTDMNMMIEEIKTIEKDTSDATFYNSSNMLESFSTADEFDCEYDEDDRYDYIMSGKGRNIFYHADNDFKEEEIESITPPSLIDSNIGFLEKDKPSNRKFTEEEVKLLVELVTSDIGSNSAVESELVDKLIHGGVYNFDISSRTHLKNENNIDMSNFNVFLKHIKKEISNNTEDEEDIDVKEDRDIFVNAVTPSNNNNEQNNKNTESFETNSDSESSNEMYIFAEKNPFFVENE